MAYIMIDISSWNEVIDRTGNQIPETPLNAIYRFAECRLLNTAGGENKSGGAILH
jgi:hypothetical protein